MSAREKEEQEEEVKEGGFCCDPVYYFGLGFLLAVWSWGRSAQPAGAEDSGWPQLDTEATWPERERARESKSERERGRKREGRRPSRDRERGQREREPSGAER